jgi:hypothetical protein
MPSSDITPLYGSSTMVGEAAHLLEEDEVEALLAARDLDDGEDDEEDQ